MSIDIEWLIGALFVSLHAFKRYNTPATNRCSTTFVQFAIYGVLYCFAMLLMYLFLAALLDSSPNSLVILQKFLNISGQTSLLQGNDFVNQSKPFISALIITTVLPNVPWLRNFDNWLLQIFWDLGRIPYFVFQQAESLRRAGYILDPGKRRNLENYSKKYGINIDTLSLDDHEKDDFSWAKLASLQLSLEEWRKIGNGRTRRFISDNEREYSLVKNLVDDLTFQFSAIRQGDPEATGRRASLDKEIAETYKRLTIFIAKALLISERYKSDIKSRMSELGFGDIDFQARNLSANQMVLIFISMFAAFLILSFLFGIILTEHKAKMSQVFTESLRMMMTYGAAVSCALLIKNQPVFSYNELTSQRPWLGYVLSGVLAIFTWLVVAWSFRYIDLMLSESLLNTMQIQPGSAGQGDEIQITLLISKVLEHLSWSYPYALQSFVIAIGLSFLVDRPVPSDTQLVAKMKTKDTIFLTVLMMLVSIGIYRWMYGIFPFDAIATKDAAHIKDYHTVWTAQLAFTLEHGMIGAVIGFLVPNWYRTNQSNGSYDSVARMIAMNKSELNNEARNLEPGVLLRAFTGITLSVGDFQGQIGRNEVEVFEITMAQLSGLSSADFSKEEAQIFLSANRGNANDEFVRKSLKTIESSKKIQMLCAWYALSIAYADHIYTDQEEERVLEIFSMLPLVDAAYMDKIKEFGRRST
jgi:hypothetical protein